MKHRKVTAAFLSALMMLGSLAVGPFALADESVDGDDAPVAIDSSSNPAGGTSGGGSHDIISDDNGDRRDGDDARHNSIGEETRFLTDKLPGDAAEARRGLARALEQLMRNPASPKAVARVAELYAKLGRWDKVAELKPQLQQAASVEDDAANILAALEFRLGQTQSALAAVRQALQDGTATPDTYRMLGLIKEREDDWYEAFQAYTRAAQVAPAGDDVYKKIGKAYRELYKKNKKNKKFKDLKLDDIPVFINGRLIVFEDVSPRIMGGRTLVPVRKLAESLGAKAAWDPVTRTVALSTPSGGSVEMVLGSKEAKVNGRPVTLDVPPIVFNGRVLLPARFVVEALGYSVGWDPDYQMVTVAAPAGEATTGTVDGASVGQEAAAGQAGATAGTDGGAAAGTDAGATDNGGTGGGVPAQ